MINNQPENINLTYFGIDPPQWVNKFGGQEVKGEDYNQKEKKGETKLPDNGMISLENVKCSQGNDCEMICSNAGCMASSPFICIAKNCKCRKVDHFNCSQVVG